MKEEMHKALKSLVILAVVPCMIAATTPVGSLTSSGDSTVSGVCVPTGTAVFPGDVVATGSRGAVLNLAQGGTIQLGIDSQVRVPSNGSKGSIEILKGMSRVQSKSHELVLLASDWRLQAQPDAKSGQFAADVLRQADGQVSLNVSSGDILAHSNHGNVTLMAQVGRPLMLPASLPEPPAPSGGPAPAPQGGGSGLSKGAWAGIVIGVAALAVGAAEIASQPSDNSSQVAALNSQIAALNSQAANLLANLNAVAAAASTSAALSAQLDLQIRTITAAQVILNGLVAKLAANGSLSAADQAT